MIIDSHEHIMFPIKMQLDKMDEAGMELEETEKWMDTQIIFNSLYGIGEFTPGSEQQIKQLETIFQALMATKIYPVWVHTFHPVTVDGIKLLMSLCEQYPGIPVIFGHLGGSNWMDVIKICERTRECVLRPFGCICFHCHQNGIG